MGFLLKCIKTFLGLINIISVLDSQFSAYSNASSPTLSHDAHDSPSQDSNQSVHTTDVFGTMKMVKKTSAQLTKQLVQETLMDEGLRVVKELANQIKEESEISALAPPNVSPPRNNSSTTTNGPTPNISSSSKNETGSRPRGRPPRLDRDYSITTASATGGGSRAPTPMSHPPPASTPSPSATNTNSTTSNNGGSAPATSPSAQNGRSLSSSAMNGPACSSESHAPSNSSNIPISASSHSVDGFAMPMTNGTNGLGHHHHQHLHPQHGSGGSNSPVVDITSSPEPMGKGTSNSLNALLAFSQKGIKQEPSSPNNAYKID